MNRILIKAHGNDGATVVLQVAWALEYSIDSEYAEVVVRTSHREPDGFSASLFTYSTYQSLDAACEEIARGITKPVEIVGDRCRFGMKIDRDPKANAVVRLAFSISQIELVRSPGWASVLKVRGLRISKIDVNGHIYRFAADKVIDLLMEPPEMNP